MAHSRTRMMQSGAVPPRSKAAVLITLLLACSGGEPTSPPDVVDPVVARLELVDPVTATLIDQPTDLKVRAVDAAGDPVAGVPVGFALLESDGELDPAQVVTDAAGIAATTWTPGSQVGLQRVRVTAQEQQRIIATPVHDGSFASISLVHGSGQEGPAGMTLDEPLVLRALNAAGEAAFGVMVDWEIASGDGSTIDCDSRTDAAGEARCQWQLGPAEGTQQLRVIVSFRTTSASILINAEAFAGLRIGPDLPVARVGRGYVANMHAAGAAGSVSWAISSGTAPPGLDLTPDGRLSGMPAQDGRFAFTIRASDASGTSAERNYSLQVCAPPLDLAVGGTVVVSFPSECAVLLAKAGSREYRIGLMARGRIDTPEAVAGELRFNTILDPGDTIRAGPSPHPLSTRRVRLPVGTTRGLVPEHVRLLEADRRRYAATARSAAPLAPASAYAIIDPPASRTFRWPTNDGETMTIQATLRHLGGVIAWYEDDGVAAEGGQVYDSVTIARETDWVERWGMQVIDDVFGGWAPPGMTTGFLDDDGNPLSLPATDLDRNGHVIALRLRPSLTTGFSGTVRSCDRLPRPEHSPSGATSCDDSNEGEIVYVAGPGRFLLTHELKHVSSLGWALLGGREMHQSWIEEGTALVASEKASRLASGVAPGTRAGPDEVLPGGEVSNDSQNMWAAAATARRFLAAAPVASLVGDPFPNPGSSSFYSASWLFHRFVEDAWGSGDGIEPLHRQNTADAGIAGIETITGLTFRDLLVSFMTAIAVDDVPAARAATGRVFRGYDFGALTLADPYDGFQFGPWPAAEARGSFGQNSWLLAAWYTAPTFFDFFTGDNGYPFLDVHAGDGSELAPEHDVVMTVTRVG